MTKTLSIHYEQQTQTRKVFENILTDHQTRDLTV